MNIDTDGLSRSAFHNVFKLQRCSSSRLDKRKDHNIIRYSYNTLNLGMLLTYNAYNRSGRK